MFLQPKEQRIDEERVSAEEENWFILDSFNEPSNFKKNISPIKSPFILLVLNSSIALYTPEYVFK